MDEFFSWQDNPDCHFMDESTFRDSLEDDDYDFSDTEEPELSNEDLRAEIGAEHIMGIGGALGGLFEDTGYFDPENLNGLDDRPGSSEFVSIKDAFKSSNDTNQKAFPIRPFEKWVQDIISGKKSIDDDFDEEF